MPKGNPICLFAAIFRFAILFLSLVGAETLPAKTGPLIGRVQTQLNEGIDFFERGEVAKARFVFSAIANSNSGPTHEQCIALQYLGNIELRNGNLTDAVKSFDNAVEFCKNDEKSKKKLLQLFPQLAAAYHRQNDFVASGKILRKGLALAEEQNDEREIAYHTFWLAQNALILNNVPNARRLLSASARLARKMSTAEEANRFSLSVNIILGGLEANAGRANEARTAFEAGLAISERNKVSENGQIYLGLGGLDFMAGDISRARQHYLMALEVGKREKRMDVQANAFSALGKMEFEIGRFGEAKRYAESALAAVQESDYVKQVVIAKAEIAILEAKNDGDYVRALPIVEDAVNQLRAGPDFQNLPIILNDLGRIYIALKRPNDAKKSFEESVRIGKAIGFKCPVIDANVGLGQLAEISDLEKSKRHYRNALLEALGANILCGGADASLALGKISLKQGRFDEGNIEIKNALDIFKRAGFYGRQGDALEALAAAARERGNEQVAREYFRDSGIAFGLAQQSEAKERVERLASLPSSLLESVSDRAASLSIWTIGLLFTGVAALFAYRRRMKNSRALPQEEQTAYGKWLMYRKNDTVFIFVHGILSNSRTCWLAKNGAYWPHLVADDVRFGNPSIYLGNYFTKTGSGIFGINDAADKLIADLSTTDVNGNPPAISKKNLIFVAHSTGGLVVQDAIERNLEQFRSSRIGLVLVACPSHGVEWAKRLRFLHRTFGNRMGRQLEREQDFVRDLERRFEDLVLKKKLPGLTSIDLFENHFIIRWLAVLTRKQVVNASDSRSNFRDYRIVPDTDHFTIAKPDSANHPSHQYLWYFVSERFASSASS